MTFSEYISKLLNFVGSDVKMVFRFLKLFFIFFSFLHVALLSSKCLEVQALRGADNHSCGGFFGFMAAVNAFQIIDIDNTVILNMKITSEYRV